MAASEINTKQRLKDLKSFLTKKMENNTKKITEKIIEKMDTKFDKLSRDSRTLPKQNQNSISNLTSQSTALQEKFAEQAKKIENTERKHGITLHMCSPVLFVDCWDGIQISSLVTLKEHTEVITKTLIHLSM